MRTEMSTSVHLHICSIHKPRIHISYSGVTLLNDYTKSKLAMNQNVLTATEQNTSTVSGSNKINWQRTLSVILQTAYISFTAIAILC